MTSTVKSWKIIELLHWGTDHFTKKGIANSRREMEWLLCNVLSYNRIDLYLKFENLLQKSELEQLRGMVKRRVKGEPFQHIIGKAPFYGRDFFVNRSVLIPRAETGVLIDRLKENGKVNSILDVGTGSGCIAITCLLENLSKNIFATDISSDALTVTQNNIQLHGADDIKVSNHNFLKQSFKTMFDVVVSNPPYIAADKIKFLQEEVRNYDPKVALTDEEDGFVFYRRFAKMFDNLLNPGGYMLLEIGGNSHKIGVEKIFFNSGLKTSFFKDLQEDFRVVEVRR